MEPIISPWLIYVLDKLEHIQAIFILLALIPIFLKLITCMTQESAEVWTKRKGLYVIVFISFIIALAIPNRNTAIKMLVVNEITPQRIEQVKDVAGNFRDAIKGDIIEIIESVTEKEEQ